ncbi:MAG: hypothetical protein M3404_08680 [Actinomycetota bacterium]|nr:hypothetical protein [Actinomycetota bacterium]
MSDTKPRTPAGLGAAGKALWRRMTSAYEFADHELALLEVAAHQADDVAALERVIDQDGYVVAGSQGQPRLSGAVTEVRQGRLALGKLLGMLALPDEETGSSSSPASLRARKAAEARWARTEELRSWRRNRGQAPA